MLSHLKIWYRQWINMKTLRRNIKCQLFQNLKGKTLINVDIAKRIVGKEKGFFLLVPPITLSPLLPRLEGNSRKLLFFGNTITVPIRLYRVYHVFLGSQILSNRWYIQKLFWRWHELSEEALLMYMQSSSWSIFLMSTYDRPVHLL